MLAKRCFDLLFTIPGLVILLPLFIMIAVWIWATSAGPVFFRQDRVGKYGVPFKIYKFRTMMVDAEKRGNKLLTVGNDTRVTSCGRFLRKSKLDELPQLLNVLIGEMSLVGPRPEVPYFVQKYPADIRDVVLSVPPGITEIASIEYLNEGDLMQTASDPEKMFIEEILPIKLSYSVRYVLTRNLWLDFKIIIATLVAIINHDWAKKMIATNK